MLPEAMLDISHQPWPPEIEELLNKVLEDCWPRRFTAVVILIEFTTYMKKLVVQNLPANASCVTLKIVELSYSWTTSILSSKICCRLESSASSLLVSEIIPWFVTISTRGAQRCFGHRYLYGNWLKYDSIPNFFRFQERGDSHSLSLW